MLALSAAPLTACCLVNENLQIKASYHSPRKLGFVPPPPGVNIGSKLTLVRHK
jgi:hypothetical protein